MRKKLMLFTAIFVLSFTIFLINSCSVQKDKNAYLREVLQNLEQINSATYYCKVSPYVPGDNKPVFTSMRYYKEYVNPADTFVGAKFAWFLNRDTSELDFCYDGNMKAKVFHEENGIVVDSFKTKRAALRYMDAPFFTKIKTLIKYALETKDSLLIESKDMIDSIQYTFTINDTIPEVIGNRIIYWPNSHYANQGITYHLWIDKTNGLPYRYKREVYNDITNLMITNIKLNHINILDFKATDYFQADYIIKNPQEPVQTKPFNFVGMKAPDWKLSDRDNNFISLNEIKSKVIMIQFTGVSCGACTASIPFLKQLVSEYDSQDFGFFGIECWSNSMEAFSRYQDRNDIHYTLLKSDKEVNKKYKIQAVPVFFILDEKRIIQKVIRGYGASVDDQIRDAINELI